MSQNGAFYQALAFDFCPTEVIESGPKSSLNTNIVAQMIQTCPKQIKIAPNSVKWPKPKNKNDAAEII